MTKPQYLLVLLCTRGINIYECRVRNRKNTVERPITDDLIELTSAIKVIPVTSADAERGFSTMNIICSSLRSRLGIERLSKLMFVSIVGPPLEDFNSSTYVNKWLASGHRGAFDNRSKRYERPQESRYSHIKKVFQ